MSLVRRIFAAVLGPGRLTLHEYRINIEAARRRLARIEAKRERLFNEAQAERREIVRLEGERIVLRAQLKNAKDEGTEWGT